MLSQVSRLLFVGASGVVYTRLHQVYKVGGANMAAKCKTCGAPILSAIEKDQGTCTACLRSDRMATAAGVVDAIMAPNQAKRVTPSSIQANQAKGETACIPVLQADQANSVLLSFRVSPSTEVKLLQQLESSGMTKAAYLRAILNESLERQAK